MLAGWTEDEAALHRSPDGFPGVLVVNSTVTMPHGSNTVEGNGKGGTDGR